MEIDHKFDICLQLLFFTLATVVLCLSGRSRDAPVRCPKKCICSGPRSVKCTYKSLTMIPNDISSSVLTLDLSGNPKLKITKTSFERFTMIRSLWLENCNLNVAFNIPRKVSVIYLHNNELVFKNFYEMFSKASRMIGIIDVSGNKIQINNAQPLINVTSLKLRYLYMDNNSMKKIYNQTFSGFNNLRTLSLQFMGIEAIEKDAFRDLSHLTNLFLNGNKLVNLPTDLFKPLEKLLDLMLSNNTLQIIPDLSGSRRNIRIDLGYNNITDISALSEMRLREIRLINLWHNNITTLPKHVFQNISVCSINLSFNKIKRIQGYSFTACIHLYELYLDSNELMFISENAFNGVQFLSILSLSNNKLDVLPQGLFANLTMLYVFLYNNNISFMVNTWKDIKSPPDLILLSDNPIRILSPDSLKGLGKHTEIHIDCDTLSEISGHRRLNSIIRCSSSDKLPLSSLLFSSWSRHLLQQYGFDCSNTQGITCVPCPLGYHARAFHRKTKESCQKCPAGGFYQDKLLQTGCKLCPAGQYIPPDKVPGKALIDCETCPAGTRSDKYAGYRACRCLSNFARISRFGPCGKCTVPGITCDKDYQMLRPGFWWSWEYNAACKVNYQAFIQNLETINESYSMNTSYFNCKMPLPHKCPNKIACLGNVHGSCHLNYTGPLCASCAKKYYSYFKMCIRCPKAWIAILEFLAYLLVLVVICVVINWADKIIVKTENKKGLSGRRVNSFNLTHIQRNQRTVADVILSLLKILLGFYQVLNRTVYSFPHMLWPKSLTKVLSVFQYIQLDILGIPLLRCIRPEWDLNAMKEFWISLAITSVVPLLIGTYYAIRKTYLNKTVKTQKAYTDCAETCKKRCVRVIILFLFVTIPSTTKRIIQILPVACHKLDLNASQYYISYMRADYRTKCLSFSSSHGWNLYIAYCSLVIPFGFVLFLLVSLAHVKDSQKVHSHDITNNETGSLSAELTEHDNRNTQYGTPASLNRSGQETTFQFALKFCHENYKPACWYWEITEILRRLLFISIMPFLAPFSSIFLGLTIIFAGFFALLHAYKKPMQNYFEHWLQLLSLSVIPANLCIVYVMDTIPKVKLRIGIILVVLNSSLILIVMLRFIRTLVHKIKQFW